MNQTQYLKQINNRLATIKSNLQLLISLLPDDIEQSEETLRSLRDILESAYLLYYNTLKLNRIVFNKFVESKEMLKVSVPMDITENVENTYVDSFIKFLKDLKGYNASM